MKSTDRISSEEVINHSIKAEDIATYVVTHGWQPISDPLEDFLLFDGPLDKQGRPIRLALPLQDDSELIPLRLSEAINQLAAVERRDPREVLSDLSSQAPQKPLLQTENHNKQTHT